MPHEFQYSKETLPQAALLPVQPSQEASAQASLMQEEVSKTTAGAQTAIGLRHDEPHVEALARRFQQASRLHRLRVRRAVWAGAGSALSLMLVNALALVTLMQTERYPFASMWWMWVLNALVFAVCVLYPVRSARTRRALAAQLAQYDDARAVGPLAELLASSDPQLRKTARAGLIRLLPRLTAGDAHWLQPEQRDVLRQALEDAERQPELAEAVVRAFANVGDATVLGSVQRVAEMRAPAARHKLLKATARECLPILRARIQQEGARQSLLRAHQRPNAEAAALLRPAAQADTPTGELLRPSEQDAP